MSTLYRYTVPMAETHWKFPASGEVCFTWDYDARSDELLKLYSKGKKERWDADTRIDWSLPVDPEDPMQMDEQVIPLWNTPLWRKLSERQRTDLRYHSQVFNLSQFLHGEQGALVCAARIVQDVPRIESKFYAATQVMDEARHVEAYRRLLTEKFKFVYPISRPLKTLIEQAINDPRWDFTCLGMQVLIEGLALVAFQRIRDYSRIVPTVRDIGLWSERVRKAYADLGGIQYANTNAQEMLDNNAKVAQEFDRKMCEGFSAAAR